MLFELGPQKETQTLPPIRGYDTKKRHIPSTLLQKLQQQYGYENNIDNTYMAAPKPFLIKHSGTPDGWLSAWRNSLNSKQLSFENRNEYDYNSNIYNNIIDKQQSVLPTYGYNNLKNINNRLNYKTLQHLRQLYKEQPS